MHNSSNWPELLAKGTVKDRLEVFISLVNTVAAIHEQGDLVINWFPNEWVFEPLQPLGTFKVSKVHGHLALKDSGSLSPLLEESSLEQFTYIAPEQTRSLNTSVHHYTDTYVLGILAYELFTGELPFDLKEERALFHWHIAQQASPIIEKTAVPVAISSIVEKLLSKEPSLRYQSTYGLLADLKTCQDHLAKGEEEFSFDIGQQDFLTSLRFPEDLSGRSEELAQLERGDSKNRYKSRLILIQGDSGVGKTRLARSYLKTKSKSKHLQLSGKFDLIHKEIPYYGIQQMFSPLVEKVLGIEENKRILWEDRCKERLKDQLFWLLMLFPDFETVFGKVQEPTRYSVSNDPKISILGAFDVFLEILAEDSEHIFLLLDDVQWADQASIQLIEHVAAKGAGLSVSILLTFRNKEFFAQADKQVFFDNVMANEPISIKLEAFDKQLIKSWLEQFLVIPEQLELLSDLCFQYTKGNPLFLQEFILQLYRIGALKVNHIRGHWVLNEHEFASLDVTTSVSELLLDRLNVFNEKQLRVLRIASCWDGTFTTASIEAVCDESVDSIENTFELATKELIIQGVNVLGLSNNRTSEVTNYLFAHDRIHETIRSGIDEQERQRTHLRIAKFIEENGFDASSESFLALVGHYNKALDLLSEAGLQKLINFNLTVGKQVRKTGEIDLALYYAELGKKISDDKKVALESSVQLELQVLLAELYCAQKQYDKMDESIAVGQVDALSVLDNARFQKVRIDAFIAQYAYSKAIETALSLMKDLGLNVPKKPGKLNVLLVFLETQRRVKRLSDDQILNLQLSDNKEHNLALEMIVIIVAALYRSSPNLFVILALKIVQFTLKDGLSPVSPIGFVTYGLLQHALFGKIDKAFDYGMLGIDLFDKLPDQRHWSQAWYIHCVTQRIWKYPVLEVDVDLEKCYNIALQNGDYENIMNAATARYNQRFFVGDKLDRIIEDTLATHKILQNTNQELSLDMQNLILQACENLQEFKPDGTLLDGTYMNEEEMLSKHIQEGDQTSAMMVLLLKLMLKLIFEQANGIEKLLPEIKKYLESAVGILIYAQFHIYEALALLFICNLKDEKTKKKYIAKARKNLRLLEKWAKYNPSDYMAPKALLQAELHRVEKKGTDPVAFYEEAIAKAKASGNLSMLALSYECYGRFYFQSGYMSGAHENLNSALIAYEQWGAKAKAKQLQEQYGTQISFKTDASLDAGPAGLVSDKGWNMELVWETSQAVAQEKELPEMFEKILKVMVEWAGAQRGCLLLRNETSSVFELVAEGRNKEGNVQVEMKNLEIDVQLLPSSLIHSAGHTGKGLVIKHAFQHNVHSQDPYVERQKVKSVMVVPIIHQSKTIGMMYFENNLATGTFSDNHFILFNLLAAQIGTAIENARLYISVEKKVKTRTVEFSDKLEHLQKKNHQLEELYELRNQLTTMLVHDLKNPLTGIMGETSSNPENRSFKKIQKWSSNMLEMIQDMVDLQRLETASMPIDRTSSALYDMVYSAIEQVKGVATKPGTSIQLQLPKAIGLSADTKLIVRVFSNLFANAFIHNPDNKILIVEANSINESQCRISITDRGKLIASSERERIFEKYYQADSDKKESVPSSGLGLAFCKMVIEAHNGQIGVEEAPNGGNRFWIDLPYEHIETEEVIQETIMLNKSEEVVFTDTDLRLLQPVLSTLNNLKVHELTRIKQALGNIDEPGNVNMESWKKQLLQTVFSGDQKAYSVMVEDAWEKTKIFQVA